MNYYERYCGDYARDTAKLTLAQHGAYTLMLDTYYATERALPAAYPDLYRICRAMTKAEQEAVRAVADEFFPVSGDGLRHNDRADEVIKDAQPRIAAARENGRHGGRPRRPPDENPDITQEKPSGFSDQNPAETHAGVHQAPSTTKTLTTPPGVVVAHSPPDCPHERIIEIYHALMPANPQVIEWNETRRGYLRARWREKAVPNGRSQGYATVDDGLAYWSRFFEWCAQSKFLTGQSDGRPGRPPFVASLEWILRPGNFAKVIEGNYHR